MIDKGWIKSQKARDKRQAKAPARRTEGFIVIPCDAMGRKQQKEEFLVKLDTRHGVEGIRVFRYLENRTKRGKRYYKWDEWYQFYKDGTDFFKAAIAYDYKQGRKDF